MNKTIAERFKRIRGNIAEACARAHRDPRGVRLIAVTKTVDVSTIRNVLELGHADLGESRVQEMVQRNAMIKESISRKLELPDTAQDHRLTQPCWHMIGHLQRNKVKLLLPVVEYIHSVDSLRLAEEINTAAARLGFDHKVKIFLQVKTSQEKQQTGVAVGAVIALAEQIMTLPNLQIVGLMTMAPMTDDINICRFCFGRLREIFEEMHGKKTCGPHFRHLSMGMSHDYITAVEEGATMLRIGTALFE